MSPDRWSIWTGMLGIALVTLLAGIARLLRLDEYPPGLAEAEAQHGLLARQSHDFGVQWAIENAASLSIPLMLVTARVADFTGFDVTTLRIAAALFGAGSVLLTGFWIYRAMGPLWGFAAAAVLAGSFWHLLFSRLAVGQIAAAFSLAGFAWFLTEAADRRGQHAMPWYLLAGLAAGTGFLAAPALRLLPLVLFGILLYSLYQLRGQPETSEARNWLVATAAAYLTITPFLMANRGDFRLWTPWAETPGLPGNDPVTAGTFPGALIVSVTRLFLAGDAGPGLNLPVDPWFSLLMLPWAAIGLLGLISTSNDTSLRERFLVGLGVLVAVGIGISAVDAGHGGQQLVISPALAGLTVYGFRTTLRWARMRTVRIGLAFLIVTGILAQAGFTGQRYFQEWSQEPATRAAFQADVINALAAVETLDATEPVFVSLGTHGTALDYFRTTGRRHTFDGASSLPFPSDEDGYLLVPHSEAIDAQLAQLLDRSGSGTASLDGDGFRGYRLDGRIRDLMPLSIPTATYPRGPVLHGASDLALASDETARVLIAWKSDPGSPPFDVETRLRTTGLNPIETAAIVELPANPLQSRLFQVLVVELEIPRQGATGELELRLRRDDGTIVPVAGMDEAGYLLINRYTLPD